MQIKLQNSFFIPSFSNLAAANQEAYVSCFPFNNFLEIPTEIPMSRRQSIIPFDYGEDDDDDDDDEDDDDEEEEDLVLLDLVDCERCHTLLANRNDFIQDLFPQSDHPRHQLLFHTASNVDYGKVEYRVPIVINEIANAEMSYIYCESCQWFAGWRIERIYLESVQLQQFGENPVFRPGQYMLFYMSGGEHVI